MKQPTLWQMKSDLESRSTGFETGAGAGAVRRPVGGAGVPETRPAACHCVSGAAADAGGRVARRER